MTQINKPNTYFNPVLYTGNGTGQSITGVNFQPDWTWIKCRANAREHKLTDVVRGVTKVLSTNSVASEVTDAGGLTSFDSDGFTVGNTSGYNNSAETFVAWNWLAGGTAVSNTQGTITSSVSANTTAGFSIATYTGNGTAGATIGHGLGDTPACVIIKPRTTTTNNNWIVYHKSLGTSKHIYLNTTDAFTNAGSAWLTPSSSTIEFTQLFVVTNNSGSDFVCYSFAEKKGFSKFGSYTGNGSTDGTFVYTGFKPAYLIVKRTDTAGYDWQEFDNKINPYNVASICLRPNVNNGDQVGNAMDLLSNGFKNRLTGGTVNASGASYIYMAFAENPLVGTNNIPATAR